MAGYAAARRATERERMDTEDCGYESFRACLDDLAAVNRLTLAYRPTLRFLDRAIRDGSFARARPLRILDAGSGQGDMLRAIAGWAERRGVAVHLTGVDLNPWAARTARAAHGEAFAADWIAADVFDYAARAAEPPDVIVSALFAHHLDDAALVRFLAWMERTATRAWFVNDLHRHAAAYWGFAALARLARWHPFVRHDGPLSIARAFKAADWERALAAAGIDRGAVEIARRFPFRLCVARMRGGDAGH